MSNFSGDVKRIALLEEIAHLATAKNKKSSKVLCVDKRGLIKWISPAAVHILNVYFSENFSPGDNFLKFLSHEQLQKITEVLNAKSKFSSINILLKNTYGKPAVEINLAPVLTPNLDLDLQMEIVEQNFKNEKAGGQDNLNSAVIVPFSNDEVALIEYTESINNILESITDGVFNITNDGRVTYWNKAAEDILQIAKGNILNQILWDFFPQEFASAFYLKIEEAIKINKNLIFSNFYQPLEIWLEMNLYPAKKGLTVYFKDITHRKKIDEELSLANERYRLVSKATKEAVYDWDLEKDEIAWNDFYYEMYGYNKLKGIESIQQWKNQLHPKDRFQVLQRLEESLKSKSAEWQCAYRLLKADKKIAYVLERGFIIRNDEMKAIRMIGSLHDMSESRQNEIALEELNYALQRHSRELTNSNAELEQFAYIASHDLQEPLRMVTGFLSQLQKKYNEQLDDKGRQYIYYAVDGAVRMRQILLDLLDYSQIGRQNYKVEEVDLNHLLQKIIKLHSTLIEEKDAEIIFNELPKIKAAAIPLQRVLSNLISNSIKYAKNSVKSCIKIEVKEQEPYWEFTVKDNGIGIDPQFFEKIFTMFQRLHAKTEYSGTGIGLAICKKIVENHGGKIWVTSQEGEGSEFHFTILKQF